jgi:hypothetical protein
MSEKLSEIWQDPAEAVGELLLEKGLDKAAPALSQIPLLSFAIAAYKSKGAISDYLLAKKVQKFYTAWETLEENERREVYKKFQKQSRAFLEKLLFILEQQEDLEKCQLLGILTTAYMQGDLKRRDYMDFIETVTHLSIGDLDRLANLAKKSLILAEKVVGERYAVLFVTRGLMTTEPPLPEEQRVEDQRTFYRITPLGLKLVECMGRGDD